MAKVITQEAVDKAVAKATAAETKRCLAAVKGVEIAAGGPAGALKQLKKDIIAAIKPAE